MPSERLVYCDAGNFHFRITFTNTYNFFERTMRPFACLRKVPNMRYTPLLVAAALLSACSGGGGGGTTVPSGTSGSATMSAALMDGPFRTSNGTVTAVNIAIAKVEAVGSGGGITTIATFSPSQQINLLNYQTAPLVLGTGSIPAGQYQQIRFVLDTSNANNTSVVVNGTTYPLTIPSATTGGGFGGATSTDAGDGAGTSGIKVNVSLNAQAGQTYGYVIDFNAAESIISAGASGKWMMKPVLVATAQATSGAISGTVKNNAGLPVTNAEVLAEQNGTPVNSGVTDANGNFQINALPAGTYTLVVENTWTSQGGVAETATGADGTAAVTGSSETVTGGQTTSGVAITD